VSRPPLDIQLTDRRYATVVLRLQLDQQGRLIQGELVDAVGGHKQRFAGWRGMTRSLRDWLKGMKRAGVSDTDRVKLTAK
jgi:hypothetical protein